MELCNCIYLCCLLIVNLYICIFVLIIAAILVATYGIKQSVLQTSQECTINKLTLRGEIG